MVTSFYSCFTSWIFSWTVLLQLFIRLFLVILTTCVCDILIFVLSVCLSVVFSLTVYCNCPLCLSRPSYCTLCFRAKINMIIANGRKTVKMEFNSVFAVIFSFSRLIYVLSCILFASNGICSYSRWREYHCWHWYCAVRVASIHGPRGGDQASTPGVRGLALLDGHLYVLQVSVVQLIS